MGPAPHYIEDGLLVTRDGSWAWLKLETDNYWLQPAGDRIAMARRHEQALASLRNRSCHLLVVPRPFLVGRWADELDESTPRPRAGWAAYLSELAGDKDTVGYLERAGLREREVHLGVRIGGRDGLGSLKRYLGMWDRVLGVADPRPAAVLQPLRNEARTLEQQVRAHVRCRLATARELRWLIRQSMWLGIEEDTAAPEPPEPHLRRSWGGELLALFEGEVDVHGRHLELSQPEGRSCVAVLALARFPVPPAALPFPGGEWLYCYEPLPYPVRASVRFRVVPSHEVAAELGKKLAGAVDQAEHIASGGWEGVPPQVSEIASGTLELQHQVTRDHESMIYGWPRLVVAGANPDELTSRVTDLVEIYRNRGIEVVRPSGEQLPLFMETMPGSGAAGRLSSGDDTGVRVDAYCQRQPLRTLAGSGYWADRRLGDDRATYVGSTRAYVRRDRDRRIAAIQPGGSPVCVDPLRAALVDEPTGISITGKPGKGKTTLANYLAYLMRLRGAVVAYIDPKKERSTEALTRLTGLGRTQVVDLDEGYEGVLDPLRFCPDPDQASQLAAELLRHLLPWRLGEEVEGALAPATTAESRESRPSLHGVVKRLSESSNARVRDAADNLRAIVRWPQARLCFARDEVRQLDLAGALTVIRFSGRLALPGRDKPPEHYEPGERMAVALMHTVTGLVGGLAELPPQVPKAVVLDEAYVVTRTERGSTMVEQLARQGRSKNLAILLATHNAADLANERIRNCLSQAFAFGSRDETEVAAVLELVRLPDSPSNRRLVRNLESGECLYRDLEERVGRVAIDLVSSRLREAFRTTPPAQTPATNVPAEAMETDDEA